MPDLQVLALDTVAPQIRAPGVGDGYAVPRNMTMGASTQFFAAAGTAALPSLTTVGDPNTGLYFPAADAVSIATAGVERLRVTPLGDIGIGITPGSFFTIQTANGYSNFKGASLGGITIGASSTEYPSIGYNVRYTSTVNSYQYAGTDTANMIRFTNGAFQFFQAASGTSGATITWNTRMVLDTNGSLGMSVTPPAWAATARAVDFSFPSFGMDTTGAAIVGFNAYNSAGTTWNYKSADEAALFTIDTAGGFTWRQAVAGTTGAAITFTQPMVLSSSGRLGIGTTNPSNVLHVRGAASTTNPTALFDGSGTSAVGLGADGNNYSWIQSFGTTPLYVNAQGNNTIINSGSGNVGIGTTAPGSKLEVFQSASNSIRVGAGATSSAGIDIAGNGNTYQSTSFFISQDASNNCNIYALGATNLRFGTSNTLRAVIDSSGNVVVGTAAIATNATNGFLYIPGCAGIPTGVPTSYTGRVPLVVDTTNNKLYFYSGGAWRDAGP